ncbi:oxidoreductase [Bacillus sp. SA1-12]|uniref:Gfo/Idh/MocA family protein n=1 Tax=Bacillus sp. SA1-12 TaxID=1455638 RepID=UPI0006264297|nr:Gfo/Idh/MocA family oxidoreductase [Bacillus sp. SA1-12]KKI92048.1 oxidoreductase [Bacillus sp. SA1-12]
MSKIKVGVIGLGEVGQIIHLPILKNLSDQFEIAALCDISEQLLQVIGEKYQVEHLYTDAEELTQQKDLELVMVLNSDEYHTDCVLSAIKNKKHVFVEKPVCLNLEETDAIIKARDEANVKVMVGYMRRYAPAFIQAVEEVKKLNQIQYVRVRDIIGQNHLMIDQTSHVFRFQDIPKEAIEEKANRGRFMVKKAIGDVPDELYNTYRLLCGLSSHDLSAMRELIGIPKRVVSAVHWGSNIHAIFEYEGFYAAFETGVDNQRRFDAHIEVYSQTKTVKVQYDTPYIRHLPTTLIVNETIDETYHESVLRPTFKDPYTHELEYLYDVITKDIVPKTSIEDYQEDLRLFSQIIDALKENYVIT